LTQETCIHSPARADAANSITAINTAVNPTRQSRALSVVAIAHRLKAARF
jgi:hypothetical protein